MTRSPRAVLAAAALLAAAPLFAGCASVPLVHPFLQSAQPLNPGQQGLGVNVVMFQTDNGIVPFTTVGHRLGLTDRLDVGFLAYSLGGRASAKYLLRALPQGPAVSFETGFGPFLGDSTPRAKLGYTTDGAVIVSRDYGTAQYYGGYRHVVMYGPALLGDGGVWSHGVFAFGYQQRVFEHLLMLGELALLLDFSPGSTGGVFPMYSVSFVMPWGGPARPRPPGRPGAKPPAPFEVTAIVATENTQHVTIEFQIGDDDAQYAVESVTIAPTGGTGSARRTDLVCRGPGRYVVIVRTPDPLAPGSYRATVVYVRGDFRTLDARRLPVWSAPPDRKEMTVPFDVKPLAPSRAPAAPPPPPPPGGSR